MDELATLMMFGPGSLIFHDCNVSWNVFFIFHQFLIMNCVYIVRRALCLFWSQEKTNGCTNAVHGFYSFHSGVLQTAALAHYGMQRSDGAFQTQRIKWFRARS